MTIPLGFSLEVGRERASVGTIPELTGSKPHEKVSLTEEGYECHWPALTSRLGDHGPSFLRGGAG